MDGYFVFDDVNSADYKIWVKAGGTYGAAARRYTSEVVPGRNGALTIDDGAYEEKEHPYECHIGDDFPENIEAFRNAIMSKVGRFVLSDSYHPDEFYRALYMRGLEPDVAALAKAGAFTLTFTRDPRRFLVSGDTPQNIPAWSEETKTGKVVHYDNVSGIARAVITATGTEVTCVGKNLFDEENAGWVNNHTINDSGQDVSSNGYRYSASFTPVAGSTRYAVQINALAANNRSLLAVYYDASQGFLSREAVISYSEMSAGVHSGTFTTPPGCAFIRLVTPRSNMADVQVEVGNATSYEAYTATVTEYSAPFTFALRPGANSIYADSGDVSVTLQLPSTLINPTRFTAQPLIRVYGQGRVDVGSVAITVTGSYPYVDIDAEMGDCYYHGANANSVVSFSGGYPKLVPGTNYIIYSGVTKVEITPRWWRL